jgi:hypothetical protein
VYIFLVSCVCFCDVCCCVLYCWWCVVLHIFVKLRDRMTDPPSAGRRAEPPSAGRRAEPPSAGRRTKPPSAGRKADPRAWVERRSPRAWVERQSPRAWVERQSPRAWVERRIDEVQSRQCPCLWAFETWSASGIRRTRRRSDESRWTQGFTQVRPPW